MRNILFSAFLLLISFAINAQQASVKADKYRIKIGEQVELKLNATAGPEQDLIWPPIADTLGQWFDVVRKDTIDTVRNAGRTNFTQSVWITSFDSGMHNLPVFDFQFITAQGDTESVLSDMLSIDIYPVAVDTTKSIKDIRGIEDVPFDYTDIIIYSVLGALVALAAVYAFYRWRKKRKVVAAPIAEKPKTPAWQRALEELERIEKEGAWKSGNDKRYHSAIADTLRAYIEEQLQLPALESTSDETLSMLRKSAISVDSLEAARNVFVLADLVKFAKEKPLPAEHERSMQLARSFVHSTKPGDLSKESEKEAGA
ncbi:MAG: hypothetical protein ACK5B6_14590 [Bacteroidia bacterium]